MDEGSDSKVHRQKLHLLKVQDFESYKQDKAENTKVQTKHSHAIKINIKILKC